MVLRMPDVQLWVGEQQPSSTWAQPGSSLNSCGCRSPMRVRRFSDEVLRYRCQEAFFILQGFSYSEQAATLPHPTNPGTPSSLCLKSRAL